MLRLIRFGAMACIAGLLAVPSLAAPPLKDWRTVRIGIDSANPPFSSVSPDQVPSGFDVAIAKALCDHMKVTCIFVPEARDALLPALLLRRSDAVVSSVLITEDGKKAVDFTDKYYSMAARFAVTTASGLTDISPDAMQSKSVGAVQGSRFAVYLTEVYAPKGAIVKLYKTEAEAFADMRDGRLNALLGGAIRLYRWFDEGTGGRCCRFAGPDIRNLKYLGEGAGIAIRKEDGELRDMFNKALADILRDGTYEKVNAGYFNFLVY